MQGVAPSPFLPWSWYMAISRALTPKWPSQFTSALLPGGHSKEAK